MIDVTQILKKGEIYILYMFFDVIPSGSKVVYIALMELIQNCIRCCYVQFVLQNLLGNFKTCLKFKFFLDPFLIDFNKFLHKIIKILTQMLHSKAANAKKLFNNFAAVQNEFAIIGFDQHLIILV